MAQKIILNNETPCEESTNHVFSRPRTPRIINCYPDVKSPDETSFYPRGCKDVWNENKDCPGDSSYYHPLAEGDELIIQTRFFDNVNYSLGDDSCRDDLGFNEAYWEFVIYNLGNVTYGDRTANGQCGCFFLDDTDIPPNSQYAVPGIIQGGASPPPFTFFSRFYQIDIGCASNFQEHAQNVFDVYFNAQSTLRVGCSPISNTFLDAIINSEIEFTEYNNADAAIIRVTFNTNRLLQIYPSACSDGLEFIYSEANHNVVSPRYETLDFRCCNANARCYLFGDDGCIGEIPENGEPILCDNTLAPGTAKYEFTILDVPGVQYTSNTPLDDNGRPLSCATVYLPSGVECGFNCLTGDDPLAENYECPAGSGNFISHDELLNGGFARPGLISRPGTGRLTHSVCANNFDEYVTNIIAAMNIELFSGSPYLSASQTPIFDSDTGYSGYRVELLVSLESVVGWVQSCLCNPNTNPMITFGWYWNPLPVNPDLFSQNDDPACFPNRPYGNFPIASINLFRKLVFAPLDGVPINVWETTPTYPNPGVYSVSEAPFFGTAEGEQNKVYPLVKDYASACCPLDPVEGEEGFARFRFDVNLQTLIYGAEQTINEVQDFAIFIPFIDTNCETENYDSVDPALKAVNYDNYLQYVNGFLNYWNNFLAAAGNSGTVSYIENGIEGTITFEFLLDVRNFTLEFGYDPCTATIPICVYHSANVGGCVDGFREIVIEMYTDDNFSTDSLFRLFCGPDLILNIPTTGGAGGIQGFLDQIKTYFDTNYTYSNFMGTKSTNLRFHLDYREFPNMCECTGGLTFSVDTSNELLMNLLYDSGECCNPVQKCNFSIDGYTGFPFDLRAIVPNPPSYFGTINIFGFDREICFTDSDLVPTEYNLSPINLGDLGGQLSIRNFVDSYVITENAYISSISLAPQYEKSIVAPWYENGELKGMIFYVANSELNACGCADSLLTATLEGASSSFQLVSGRSICCDAQDCPYPDTNAVLTFTLEDPIDYDVSNGDDGCFNIVLDSETCSVDCGEDNLICISDSGATNFDDYRRYVITELTNRFRAYDPNVFVYMRGTQGYIHFNKESFDNVCNTTWKVCEPDCTETVDGPCEGFVAWEVPIPPGLITNPEIAYDMNFTLNCPFNPSVIYLAPSYREVAPNVGETIGEAIVRTFNALNSANHNYIHIPAGTGGIVAERVRVEIDYAYFRFLCGEPPCDCGDLAPFGDLNLEVTGTACTGNLYMETGVITNLDGDQTNSNNRFRISYRCASGLPEQILIDYQFGDSSVTGIYYTAADIVDELNAANVGNGGIDFTLLPGERIGMTISCEALENLCPELDNCTDIYSDFTISYLGYIAGVSPWIIIDGSTWSFGPCSFVAGSTEDIGTFPGSVVDCTLTDTSSSSGNIDIDINLFTLTPVCCENNVADPPPEGNLYPEQDVIIIEPEGPNPLCCPPVIGSVQVQDCCCNTYEQYNFADIVEQQLISIDNNIPQTFQNFKINWENLPKCFSLRFVTETSEFVTDCFRKVDCEPTVRLCANYPDGFQDCRGNIYGLGTDPCEETLDEEGNGLKYQLCERVWGSLTLAEINIEEEGDNTYTSKESSEKWRLLTKPLPGYVVRKLENMFVAPYVEDEQGRQFKMINNITQNIENSSMWHLDVLLERIDGGCSYDASCLDIV